MSEIVAATATQVLEGVASAAGQSATQTTAEWLAQAQFERIVSEAGAEAVNAPVYRWDYSAADAFDKVVDGSNAQQAFENWYNSGGNQSPTGSATQPPVKGANPQTAIKKAGAGTATVGGLLSMSLPTWVAAAAPLLGVAVGVGLYELSPEFWTKISQKLLPFCYEDSQAMPVVTDEDGNTYIDKEAVEALKEAFDESGVNPDQSYTYQEYTDPATGNVYNVITMTPGTVLTQSGAIVAGVRGDPRYICVLEEGGTRSHFIPVGDGAIFITRSDGSHGQWHMGWSTPSLPLVPTSPDANYSDDFAPGPTHEVGMPEGTSKWTGSAVDVATLPVTQVYTDPADATKTRDYIPVALPTTPGQSLDPEENPDPTTNENPEEQISPYIMPTIDQEQYPEGSESEGEQGQELDKNAPIPIPFPGPDSTPDTQANPNDQPDQPPQKLVDLIPPIDVGNIPKPNMPVGGDPLNVDGGVGGLVSVYNPTYAELQAFAQWLWVTYADATIDKIWNNPFDGVISLHHPSPYQTDILR